MEQRALGDSGLFSSAIGFGTWEMSTTMYGHIDVGEASAAVNAAIDHGITLFDTAESYGPYHSEVLLAKALGNRRKDIVLVTKVGLVYDESGKTVGCNSKHDNVIQSAEGCLRRLDTDYLDLLLIHWPDHDTPFEEPVRALNRLKDEGKIRHYGVSNFTPEMMDECERHGRLAANQVGYHMFDRRMESRVLPYCLDKDIGFMAYGTLGFGLLAGAFTPRHVVRGGRLETARQRVRSASVLQGRVREGAEDRRTLEVYRRALREIRRSAGDRLDDRPRGRFGRAGGHAQRAGTQGERCRDRVEARRRGPGRGRRDFCGRGCAHAHQYRSGVSRGRPEARRHQLRPALDTRRSYA